MGRLFGTDGVRGLANRDVTAELALGLSVAAARVLAAQGQFVGHRPRAIVGRDSRVSGEFLAAAESVDFTIRRFGQERRRRTEQTTIRGNDGHKH